ncbi:hypothetical protein LCGC14_1092720 [marine sediment metagenome]|uniref:deoxyribose-phosphate aldolase n=1 Tax=marine sediment metagenome TaxID=412755 RepID=A0A0F9MBY8_9ZZZZ
MSIASRIDHTNLKANAISKDIENLCFEAKDFGFRAVCTNSKFTKLAKKFLTGSSVSVVTVIDFPLGSSTTDVKINAIRSAIELGTDELDVVWDVSSFLEESYEVCLAELDSIIIAANLIPVKIIVETALIPEDGFGIAYDIVKDAGAKFIKTSTGQYLQDKNAYSAVKCWSKKDGLLIKASGGIRDLETAKAFITRGADVIGTSSGIKIMRQEKE